MLGSPQVLDSSSSCTALINVWLQGKPFNLLEPQLCLLWNGVVMGIKAAIARGTHGSRKVGYYWGGSSSSCHPYHLTQYNKHTWLQG